MVSDREYVPACSHSAAKYAYGSIFLVISILSWILRGTEFGYSSLNGMRRLKQCNGKADCLEAQGVFRMSFGCFMFFFVMFVSTVGTSEKDSCRGRWHSGSIGIWISKFVLICLLIFISFFLPPEMISIYGGFAYAGAWFFLIFQSISIMSFINKIHKWCHPEKDDEDKSKKYWFLLIFANIMIWVPIIFMFYWYVIRTFCKANFLIIFGTVTLIGGMYSLSLLPGAKAVSLRSSLMGTYVLFLCGSAIKSEPPVDKCAGWGGSDTSKVDALTIIGFLVAFGAMVFAVYSTGIDSESFRVITKHIPCIPQNKYDYDDDDVPYGYGFFHLVFATASMYSAMLFVNWNIHHPSDKKFAIDSGWTSTWMKIANEVFTAIVYGTFYLMLHLNKS
ncbi:unnamed protein product [Cuscuta epithymum]|uniref:Serinc-domain containing serine and sphingolipid biosynthesis protein n=1 Tax=Cuscuta epithymum TaxID=186058 RepID=A0AAV0G7R9_9ASTE|nr:unnamed protein product [Cuscuta epithymum]